jgi:hypothetical protein
MNFADPEDRARFLRSSGWEGMPELEDIEGNLATPNGGLNQRILSCMRKMRFRQTKADERRMYRLWLARPEWFDKRPDNATFDAARIEESDEVEANDRAINLAHSETPMAVSEAAGTDVPKSGVTSSPIDPVSGFSLGPIFNPFAHERSVHRFGEGQQLVYVGDAPLWPRAKGRSNPFQVVVDTKNERSSDLLARDTAKVYDAMAFALWRHEAIMTAHVIILWETLGVVDHRHATKLLGLYLNEAQKWAGVGKPGESRQRRRERSGHGFDFQYVYVHENGMMRGFHSHILCNLPRELSKQFRIWTIECLSRLARQKCHGSTVFVVTAKGRTKESNVARGWWWFRYLMKQLSPDVEWGRIDEPWQPLRDILQVWSKRDAMPVTCAKLTGVSQDIGSAAQKEAGFVSRLTNGDLTQIYAGRELDEGRHHRYVKEILTDEYFM